MNLFSRPRTAQAGAFAAVLICLLAAGCSAAPDEAPERPGDRSPSAPAAGSDARSGSDSDPARNGKTETDIEGASKLCGDGSTRRELLFGGSTDTHRYEGHVVEPRGPEYDVRATVSDDGCMVIGTVEYVELGCSGAWTSVHIEALGVDTGPAPSLRVDFDERIDRDPDGACASEAHVTLLWGPAGVFYYSDWLLADGQSTDSRTHLDLVG